MYLDPDRASGALVTAAHGRPCWTVLIPFFNEQDYLAATIASLADQTERFELVLVDNGSTDASPAVALAAVQAHGLPVRLITERRPGKVSALAAGLAAVGTRYVATCDADTIYPAGYLREAGRLLARAGCVAAGAFFVAPGASAAACRVESVKIVAAGALLPRLCHAGGAGQCFDTAALRAAGGFDPMVWDFILEDHEVFHRLLARGTMLYSHALWCVPSPRDRDRPQTRWQPLERLFYVAAGLGAGDWFFYRFLAGRLARRRLMSRELRERGGETGSFATAAPHPVC
ncbi:glycosyltransferase family A protein [Sphingomonas sp.]|uniref:glycosyltransferase family A protein n=1 Tax=Sphingomonas sp. TaxID=28214 RepID=UPI003CC60169